MTREFYTKFHCSNCGCLTVAETGFSQWIRSRKDLDSRDGHVVADMDYLVHRYRTELGRDFQCLMLLEVKTRGAEPSPSQKDTLLIFDQLFKNRRGTPTKDAPFQAIGATTTVVSALNRKRVTLKAFGCFVVQFEKTGPLDSEWIKWGPRREVISVDQLAGLLRFDIDPDTLRPMDWRRHHAEPQRPLLDDTAA